MDPVLGWLYTFFLTIFQHYLRTTLTYFSEDKSAFLDFHFHHNHSEYQPHTLFQHHVTVEVAVVCSKDFSNNFNQDREMISDYLTAYFWDMSSRFRTLHQNRIFFSVTSLTIIKSKEEQPFIKSNSRNGHKSLAAILPLFQKWISSNSSDYLHLPGFDVAMLFMEPNLENGKVDVGALSEFQGACQLSQDYFESAIVLRAGNMTAAMLEMANLLGARVQNTQCGHHPRVRGTLVRGLKNDLEQFLSYCADSRITDFIESPKSSCLHTTQGSPIIDPDFDSVLPPSILDQCGLLSGSRNSVKAVTTEAGNECALTKCQSSGAGSVLITPLANSRCGAGGRCFQGRCLPTGSLLTNVGTGMCLRRNNATLQYYLYESFILDRCPRSAAPSDTFHVVEVPGETGKMLKVPCGALTVSTEGGAMEQLYYPQQFTFKCLDMCLSGYPSVLSDGHRLEVCDERNSFLRWEFRDMDDERGEFLLQNVASKNCPYADLNTSGNFSIKNAYGYECDKNNSAMRWKLFPVLPDAADSSFAKAQLRPQLSFQVVNSTDANLLNLSVSLHNPDASVSVAPGVIMSWSRKSNVTLLEIPENCFPFPPHPSQDGDFVHSLKCKVGRLLQKNETALVATLTFNATSDFKVIQNLQHHDLQEAMGVSVTSTMASLFKADTRTHY